ncbi:MAG: YncE family protein [Acidobacteriia bacterium]|nr:YncE family protein [Terriglobia bacterium]
MGKYVEHSLPPVQTSVTFRKRRRSVPAGIAAALAWVLLSGCGDVYRPVANPVLKPGGDPQAARVAVVLSNNNGSPGMSTSVDISGDTNIGNFVVGRSPVHAAFAALTAQALVANKNDDSLSVFTPLAQGSTVTFITLPAGSAPVYLASTQVGFMYVANSGTNSVGVITTFNNALETSIPVGRTPVALVQTPDTTLLYSVNKGDGTVSAISPPDNSVVATIPVGSSPVAAAINSDGKTLYVANQGSGTVSAINVASNTVVATVAAGASPTFLLFEPGRRRLYVANTGSNTISVFDADIGLTLIKTVAVDAGPASIAALPDGTRLYVANAGCSDAVNLTGCSGTTVTVLDAVSLAVRKTITVGSTPVSLAADAASTKVVVANRDSNSISCIRTSDDTVINTIASGSPQPTFVVISQ